MTKKEAIDTISDLYPPDSMFDSTRKTGLELLERAKKETNYYFDWRDLPEKTLIVYAELCIYRERREANEVLKRF